MKHFLILLALAVLPGCAVTLHGNQTTGSGGNNTHIGSSVQGGKQFSNARVGFASGTPPATHAAGGQLALSGNASVVLVAALVIAGTVELISDWLRPAAPRVDRLPEGNVSQTCSCYGWQPEPSPDNASQ